MMLERNKYDMVAGWEAMYKIIENCKSQLSIENVICSEASFTFKKQMCLDEELTSDTVFNYDITDNIVTATSEYISATITFNESDVAYNDLFESLKKLDVDSQELAETDARRQMLTSKATIKFKRPFTTLEEAFKDIKSDTIILPSIISKNKRVRQINWENDYIEASLVFVEFKTNHCAFVPRTIYLGTIDGSEEN